LQHFSITDRVSNDDLVPMAIGAAKVRPVTRQRPVWFVITSAKPRVVETGGSRAGPARSDGIHKHLFSHDAGISLMRSIESDPLPIDKLVTGPRSRHTHGVVIIKHPGMALGDASWSIVETHCNSFVSDVVRRHSQGPVERRAEIHAEVLRSFLK